MYKNEMYLNEGQSPGKRCLLEVARPVLGVTLTQKWNNQVIKAHKYLVPIKK